MLRRIRVIHVPNCLVIIARGGLQLRSAVAQVRAVREAGGPDYDIAIDVHGRWNTKSTIEIIRAFEPYRLFFYEEAVPPENIAAMAEVQRIVNVPLATMENRTFNTVK